MSKNPSPAPVAPGASSNIPIWAAILVAVVGLVYSNTLHAPFLHDDFANIVENQGIRNIFPIFGASDGTGFVNRPTIRLSFAINHALGGDSVTGYHILSILIHAASALALFALVLLTLSRSPSLKGRFGGHETPIAFFTALLWAVHPIHTQAVTYLSQRCESMAGLFFIATLYGAALASFGKRPLWGWLVAIPAFFLGLGSKEILVTAPVVVAAWQFLFAPRPLKDTLRRSAPIYAAFLAGILIFAYFQAVAKPTGNSLFYDFDLNRWNYFRTEPEVLIHYLKLAFWPNPLVFDYWWPIERGLGFIPYALVLAAGFLATAFGLYKRHPASFAGVAFFTILAPSSSIIALTTPAVEYRMYLPLAAIVATVAVAAASFVLKRGRKAAIGLFAAASIAALALACTAFVRNLDYKDWYTIWMDTAEKRPDNPRAQENLGVIISDQGDLLGGMARYKKAIAIDSRYTTAYYNVGKSLAMQNRHREAVEYYIKATRLAPGFWRIWLSLGISQCLSGSWDDGVKSFETALRLDPGNPQIMQNLQKARRGPNGQNTGEEPSSVETSQKETSG
ncbi:MAG: tetratricopeptide repeat protein [Deltaproteobacteria bacterium]|nr:tetratricopeptide repeat protein [Deltaproteobacteria bacterium]